MMFLLTITLLNPHETGNFRYLIYGLSGISFVLILLKSSSSAKFSLSAPNVRFSIIGGVSVPLCLIFFDPISMYNQAHDHQRVGITVFVHGKKSKMDMVLQQNGYVLMERYGDRTTKPISENGDAHFENLLLGDKVRLDIKFSEPYHAVYKDSVYTIDQSGKIYLLVALEGIDEISGMVLYKDNPLPGVIVETGDLKDTTNEIGQFKIKIPELLQTKKYEVWFIKKGFKTKRVPAYPQTGEQLNIVMEK